MNKLLLLIFISVSFRLFAQPNAYRPFPEDTALWIVEDYTPTLHTRHFYIQLGDTVINGVPYNKLHYEKNIYNGPSSPATIISPYRYIGGLRQDSINKRVFFIDTVMTKDTLLYDFNMQTGDTLPATYLKTYSQPNWPPLVLTNINDTVMWKNEHYNKYDINGNNWGNLIEGVGSDNGMFELLQVGIGVGRELGCFLYTNISASLGPLGGQSMCGYYGFMTGIAGGNIYFFKVDVSPNPSTGIVKIEASEKFKYSIYDIFGTEIMHSDYSEQSVTLDLSTQPKGIYFVRGMAGDKIFSRKIILQ